jgi:hypothetical protein
LSTGEFVINAESTKRLGVGLLSALNSGATFGPGRAQGGLINANNLTNATSVGIAASEKGAINQFVKKTLPYVMGINKSPGVDLTRNVSTIFGNVGKYSPRLLKEIGKNIKIVPVVGSIIGGLITGYDEYKKTGNFARAFGKGAFSAGMGIGGSALAGFFTAGNPIAAGLGGVAGSIAGEKLFDMMVGPPKAQGGLIGGPGTSTSDNILTPTSPGEFVVSAKATKAYGTDMLDNINKGTYKPSQAPAVNNVVNVNMDKMEAKLDKLAAVFANMKIDLDGNTVGRVSLNARSPLDRLSVVG